ncbi:hypothetical protein ACFW04_014620 [Cataglyphis niger]
MGDYHDEINNDTFYEWLKNILLSLDHNTVIVMDHAPYHFTKQDNKTILRLLSYHCELNPIEIVWSMVKGYVKSMLKMKRKRCRLMEIDHIADSVIDRISSLIINVTGKTDSEISGNDY